MSTGLIMACSFALNFGVPMALATRELFVTKPPRPHRRDPEPEAAPPPPPAPLAGKKLPDCLIPKPTRTPELV